MIYKFENRIMFNFSVFVCNYINIFILIFYKNYMYIYIYFFLYVKFNKFSIENQRKD